jgi:hypothetical protein
VSWISFCCLETTCHIWGFFCHLKCSDSVFFGITLLCIWYHMHTFTPQVGVCLAMLCLLYFQMVCFGITYYCTDYIDHTDIVRSFDSQSSWAIPWELILCLSATVQCLVLWHVHQWFWVINIVLISIAVLVLPECCGMNLWTFHIVTHCWIWITMCTYMISHYC